MFWAPPEEAITNAAAHALDPPYSQYGNDEGISELRSALEQKVRDVNKLEGVRRIPLPVVTTTLLHGPVYTARCALCNSAHSRVVISQQYWESWGNIKAIHTVCGMSQLSVLQPMFHSLQKLCGNCSSLLCSSPSNLTMRRWPPYTPAWSRVGCRLLQSIATTAKLTPCHSAYPERNHHDRHSKCSCRASNRDVTRTSIGAP